MENPPQSLARGRGVIKEYVATLPGRPGVYRMIDAGGQVLYVGKARHLKNRVTSYLNVDAQGDRTRRMIAQTASMEFTTTNSEVEALLLEANLVQKLLPRYNVLLKDDKTFPSIFISGDHEFPRISKHRGPRTGKGKYYGPFVSALAVNETIALLQKAFLLRPCADTVFKNRSRPCLQYQLKRCSAPCVNKISKENYAALTDQATAFLSGKSREIQDRLVAEMQELSLKMDYEKATVIRDRIRALTHVQQYAGAGAAGVGDADIVALAREGGQCCIVLSSIRGGRNYGSDSWFITHSHEHSDSEILSAFMTQWYQKQPAPPLILTGQLLEETSLLEEALRLYTEYKVEISHPLRGPKRELVNQMLRNAGESLRRRLSMRAGDREALESVAKIFGLEGPPARIEVYDNSHIGGTHPVGAMIVAGPEGFVKAAYRKFNIKQTDLAPGDDYAMLREMLSRRFKHLPVEGRNELWRIPELVLIDGGAGQLSAALAVLEEMGVQGVTCVGIAKGPDRNAGREKFFMPGRTPFTLPENDMTLHYLQRLRDEAHRFAIGAHRKKRSKSLQRSQLDAIPLIGPGRKKALLLYFGSAKAVANASEEDIRKVPGINKSTAAIIYRHFHT